MAVLAAHLILIPYTWCSVNPARSFGSAVVYGLWGNHWIWWVSPIIAAVAGKYFPCFVSGDYRQLLVGVVVHGRHREET